MREVRADPAADAQSAAEKAARLERRKEKARKRAEKSYARRKLAKKASAAQRNSTPGAEAAASADGAAPLDGGLAAVLAADAPPGAEAQASPEELAAQKVLEAFDSAEKVAAFLARMQMVAAIAASKSPRGAKVVAALDWADTHGNPTDGCKMGVELAWPWLSAGGVEWLALMGPGFMAACGALILVGPACIVAWDELEAHRADRARLVNGKAKPESKDDDKLKKTPEAQA